MPKFFKKTLILIIITAIFMAPISAGVRVKKAEAQTETKQTEFCGIKLGKPQIIKTASDGAEISVQIDVSRPAADDGDGIAGSSANDGKIEGSSILNFLNPMVWDAAAGCTGSANSTDYEANSWNPMIVSAITKSDLGDGNGAQFYLNDSSMYIDVADNSNFDNQIRTPIQPIITAKSQILIKKISIPATTTSKTYYARVFLKNWNQIVWSQSDSEKFTLSTDDTKINPTGGATQTVTNIVLGNASFQCNITSGDGFVGCIAFAIYYVIWEPSAAIAGFAGKILDFFIYYSTNSTSYSAEFVTKAWGAVRDIANIFFIIALLYVAIKTILGLNVTDNKRLVGAVIIIALIINFSLFTTKVVIDASNILAKVFYNNITSKDENQKTLEAGAQGEKSISAGLSRQFNPQTIIKDYNTQKGQFIFVTLLSAALMLFMAYIFFSIALLFVGRVVSLWISMIFSPLAFVSYAVPFEIPGFGHKEWWKTLFETAFLAPIFIFFLYIIILFGDFFNLIAYDTKGADFTQTAMKTIIPFAIIFMLLLQAKKLAVKFSGDMGEVITKAGAVIGGLAVGGTAIGAAALGRKTIGSVSKYVQNDAARNKDFKTFGDYKNWSLGKKINPFAYVAQAGKTATAATAAGIHGIGLGKKMKEADEGYGHKTHATHILDAKMQSEFGHTYGKDAKYKDLSEHEQEIVKAEIDKDELSKFQYGKLFKDLEAPQAKIVKDQYDGRDAVTGALTAPKLRAIDNGHGKTDRIGIAGSVMGDEKIKSDYFVGASKANQAMGEFVQALRKGSYDVRNLPDMSAKSKGFFPKLVVGVGAAVATGMRAGLKTSLGVNAGTPQKDFFKDIGNIISESLKSVKIDTGKGHGGGDSHPKEVKSVGH